ncbi:MAG: ATP-binding cassette subfamily B multidrug efflux pump, partial [Polaribacter sp.]
MSKITGKAFDLDILGRVLKYVKPYRTRFVFTFLLTVCLAGISPLRPILIQHTFDNYIVTPDADGLLMMTLVIVAVLLLEALLYYFYTFSANWLGQTVIKDLRMEIYNHINSLKLQYFDKTAIGTLVTRVVSDIETIADIFSNGILVIFGDILKLVTVVAVMFYVDWQLTLISLSTIPILLVATYIFKNGIRSSFQDVRTQVSRLNAFLQEHITGMHIVQVFNREKKEMERFQEINAQHRDAHIRSIWYYAVFMPVVEILSATSLGLIVWWGAGQVMRGEVSLGDLVMFILFIHMLFRPIRELADKFNTLQMGVVSSERVFRVLDTKSNIEDSGSLEPTVIEGAIEFKN